MQIDHVYERETEYVVFAGEACGWHYDKDGDGGKEIKSYLLEHPEALIDEPKPPEPTEEEKAAQARAYRDRLLAQSDWTQVEDAPFGPKAAWAKYRQALRDWPESKGFPDIASIPEYPKD